MAGPFLSMGRKRGRDGRNPHFSPFLFLPLPCRSRVPSSNPSRRRRWSSCSLVSGPWEEHGMGAACSMEGRILDVSSPPSTSSSLAVSPSSSAHGRSTGWESSTSCRQSTTPPPLSNLSAAGRSSGAALSTSSSSSSSSPSSSPAVFVREDIEEILGGAVHL